MHRQERWLDAYIDGDLSAERVVALEEHVRTCSDCRTSLADRQRLLGRLRAFSSAPHSGPTPDQALLDRLCQPHSAAADSDWAAFIDAYSEGSRLRRVAPALASVAAMVLVVGVLGAAWLLGGTDRSNPAADVVSAAWTGDSTELTGGDIERLRGAGWNCPEFTDMGLALVGAKGQRVDGAARLVLDFSGAAGDVRVVESGKSLMPSLFGGPDGNSQSAAPTEAGSTQRPETRLVAGEQVSLRTAQDPGTPHRATVEMDATRYEVESTLGEQVTVAVLRRIVVSEHSKLAPDGVREAEGWERIGRGMARLMVLDTGR